MAENLLVPGDLEKDKDIIEICERVTADLPLQGCTFEINPLTGHMEFVAPEGMAFRMTGKFIIDTDQSDISFHGPPKSSEELFYANDEQKEYDRENAFWYDEPGDALYREPGPLVSEFAGKRLGISVNGRYMGYIKPTGDGWEKHWGGPRTSDSDKPRVEVHIYGEPNAWYEVGGVDYAWQHGEDDKTWGTDIYWLPLGRLGWQTEEASALWEQLKIELVPYDGNPAELSVSEMTEEDKQLWTPLNGSFGLTAQTWLEGMQRLAAPIYEGVELNEQVKSEIWASKRRSRPLADDPLKNFWIIDSRAYEQEPDLDQLAARAEQTTKKPPTYWEAEEAHKVANQKQWRDKHKKELQETLFEITGSTALSTIVEADRDGRWLEREMAAYDADRTNWDF